MKAAKALAILVPLALVAGLGFGAYRMLEKRPEPATPSVITSAPADDTPVKVERDEPPLAILTEFDGEFMLRRSGKYIEPWVRMELSAGDELSVGQSGKAIIVWPGQGRTTLDIETELALNRLSALDSSNAWSSRLKLEAGRVWTRFERLLTNGSSFEIRSGNIITAVRGTSFGVARSDGETKLQVTDSSVQAFAVRDRWPTDSERTRGIFEVLEEVVGEAVDCRAGQELTVPSVPEDGRFEMPEPVAMDDGILADPFILEADRPILPEELDIVTVPQPNGIDDGPAVASPYDGLNLLDVTPDDR
jgi:hypothetical protein